MCIRDSLHSMRGEREACLKLCQEMLFWGEMNVMQSIGMQLALYTEDPAHLAALLRAAEGAMELCIRDRWCLAYRK